MKHDHLHLDTAFVPFNPKAHWKKMFSREYGVQYTETSLRSLSPEVGILPHSFLEQIYVPDGNNEVCYVDEHQWDKFLSLLHQKWADHPTDFEKTFIECGMRYLSYARDTAELDVKKESNASLLRHYKKYQKLCADYTAFIWAAYYLN